MGSALDELLELLDLEKIEENIYRGQQPDEDRQRVFGGQVAGQALVAATRTVDAERHVHSLHAYFLRPGDPSIPILYEVDRIRDGKSFTTRRVVAVQHGKAIFNLQASFHAAEDGLDFSVAMPDAPEPTSLPTFKERMAPYAEQMGDWYHRPRPIDMRYVDQPLPDSPAPEEPQISQRVWMRADGTLPDDDGTLHACVVTYASDMTLLDTTLLPHRIRWTGNQIQMASLDHAMWFHRPFRADEWLLYAQDTTSTSSSRGLARGLIFDTDGRVVVSVMQEGLIRLVR